MQPKTRNDDIGAVESRIGYAFTDPSRLQCALTHKSYANENGGASNGRLEFLGDSVLNLIVAEYLYDLRADEEGVLTAVRQGIVSEKPLADAVRRLNLLAYCRLGKGAQRGIGAFGDKPTSDVFEAILGAIYLDGGMAPARAFVHTHLLAHLL